MWEVVAALAPEARAAPFLHDSGDIEHQWLEVLWTAGTGRLSWQVLHEFYWNAVRKIRLAPTKGTQGR
jgi:hypothetical protein